MLLRAGLASRRRPLLAAWTLLLVAGCMRRQSADEALTKALAAAGRKQAVVYPLTGTITIDGAPPKVGPGERIIVMLNDPKDPDTRLAERPYAVVNPTGGFVFHTYTQSDGVKPGVYVLSIAKLREDRRKGFVGPDGFHNLYNDPQRNQKENPELNIDHQRPGKTNYELSLDIAGREPATPGEGALTELVFRRKQ
jgi:hypothetical protein